MYVVTYETLSLPKVMQFRQMFVTAACILFLFRLVFLLTHGIGSHKGFTSPYLGWIITPQKGLSPLNKFPGDYYPLERIITSHSRRWGIMTSHEIPKRNYQP